MNLNDNIEFLSLRLQTNPDSYLFARLADYLLSNGEADRAIEVCENGLKKHPYYVSAHFVMGKCYLQKKMYDQAEKEFKRVLFFDPKFLAAHKYYAEIMQHIGWDNAVENSYRSILQIDPLDQETRHKLAELVAEKKEAIQDEDTLPFPESDESEDIFEKEELEEEAPERDTEMPSAELAVDEATQSSEETLSDDDESTLSEKIFEAVIEEEPPSAEEEEKFSYILDDIFREESAIDDNSDAFETREAKNEKPEAGEIFSKPETETVQSENSGELPEDFFTDSEMEMELTEDESDSENEIISFETEAAPKEEEEQPVEQPKVYPTPRPPAETEELEELKELARDVQTNGKSNESKIRKMEESLAEMPAAQESFTPAAAPKRKKEKIVTPTLGEIYAAQGQYAKAIGVFEILRKKEPTNSIYIEKIKYLKKKLEEANSEA